MESKNERHCNVLGKSCGQCHGVPTKGRGDAALGHQAHSREGKNCAGVEPGVLAGGVHRHWGKQHLRHVMVRSSQLDLLVVG